MTDDLKKVCDLLKSGDEQTIVTIVGPIIRIERGGNVVELAREILGVAVWLTIRLNGKLVYQG